MANSTMYTTLQTTATNFIHSCRPSPPGSNTPQRHLILSHLSSDFTMSWGHKHFVSTAPPLQGLLSGDQWQDHMAGMAAKFQTWTIEITDMVVDVEKRKVVVRGDFGMVVKGSGAGAGEGVLNDILFVMGMDERGGKVVECMEFVDPVAAGEIKKRMEGVKR